MKHIDMTVSRWQFLTCAGSRAKIETGTYTGTVPSSIMSALAAGQCVGSYLIVRLLGEGGMGSVYEAKQEPIGRRVALKTLHPEFAFKQDIIARFFNEAKVLSRLEHPSIVQVSDFGTTSDGMAYLVMEYLRGESLARRLRTLGQRGERLQLVTALQFTWQVADILSIAHAQGIVHRDLKPDNLMLVGDPIAPGGERVKVLDFGIAKLTNTADRGGAKTDTHAVMGTPMYMSPEQCAGAGGVDAKTDVYSLACVLYEALAGRPPFVAEGAGQLIGMHLFQTPPFLGSLSNKIPPSVSELVHRLLTKDKSKRPSMSEVADDIGRLLSKLPGGGRLMRSRVAAGMDSDATSSFQAPAGSTTLGQLTGQRHTGRSNRTGLLVAIGLGSFALVSFLAVRSYRNLTLPTFHNTAQPLAVPAVRPPPVAPEPEIQPKIHTDPPRLVYWRIESDPSQAIVLDEKDQRLGTTPWTHAEQAATGVTTLRLRLDSYVDGNISIERSSDFAKKVALVRKPLIPAAPVMKRTPRPEPKNPVSTSTSMMPPASKRMGYED